MGRAYKVLALISFLLRPHVLPILTAVLPLQLIAMMMPKSSSSSSRKSISVDGVVTSSGVGQASIYHALVVIFLEFFAWGLLTSPMITVLNETFPDHTFLMNGLIVGVKGILSFLCAPLIGALSDIWGRKFFLLITVFFTCAPIPLMKVGLNTLIDEKSNY
jgi:hypothetical protein